MGSVVGQQFAVVSRLLSNKRENELSDSGSGGGCWVKLTVFNIMAERYFQVTLLEDSMSGQTKRSPCM